MRNPFLRSFEFFILYLFAWGIVALLQVITIQNFKGMQLIVCLQQITLGDLLFASLLLLIWPIVRFIKYENANSKAFFRNHTVLILLFFGAWLMLMLLALQVVPAQFEPLHFFRKTLPCHFMTGLMAYMAVIAGYYIFIFQKSFAQKVEKESALHRSVKDTELQLLKSQLHPHFIFNSLNSVNALIMTDPDGAQDMLFKLSDYLRMSLEQKDQTVVLLKQELEFGGLYLSIEKIRFGNRLEVIRNIEPGSDECSMPSMILQPLYENVIKHGLSSVDVVGLNITSSCSGGFLLLTISNNYASYESRSSRKGLGIVNVQRRLSLLYGRKDCLQVHASEGIFEVKLSIPQPVSL